MTTTATTPQVQQKYSEAVFMEQLEKIFKDPFNAKVYPSPDGAIEKARINTDAAVSQEDLYRLIELAGKWQLNITIGRSGAGLKVLFHKEK